MDFEIENQPISSRYAWATLRDENPNHTWEDAVRLFREANPNRPVYAVKKSTKEILVLFGGVWVEGDEPPQPPEGWPFLGDAREWGGMLIRVIE